MNQVTEGSTITTIDESSPLSSEPQAEAKRRDPVELLVELARESESIADALFGMGEGAPQLRALIAEARGIAA